MYIFKINYLSVVLFAIIFSHSEGCLFTLLIVSFIVQNLLSLIRSHLFIFAFISITLGGGHRGSCCDVCQMENIGKTLSELFFFPSDVQS